jgi:nucleolar protein 4
MIFYVVILPNTPAAESLTQIEIERRTSSFNARRTLLRSNPSLFISKTRLSIRQIPLFVTERVLKRLAVHAVRTFETEVNKRLRTGLTPDELVEIFDDEDGAQVKEEDGGSTKTKARKKGERGTGVKQAKIVRQHERVDPVTGKGRSKGYGFLEMVGRADALHVLRWANNNPDVGPLFEQWWKDELEDLIKHEKIRENKDEARLKRMKDELDKIGSRQSKGTLIAEFSIENVQVVQRRSALQKDRASVSKTLAYMELGHKFATVCQGGGERPPREKVAFSKQTVEEGSRKKRRMSTASAKESPTSTEPTLAGKSIGSLIGRKRKERKSGKKRGG